MHTFRLSVQWSVSGWVGEEACILSPSFALSSAVRSSFKVGSVLRPDLITRLLWRLLTGVDVFVGWYDIMSRGVRWKCMYVSRPGGLSSANSSDVSFISLQNQIHVATSLPSVVSFFLGVQDAPCTGQLGQIGGLHEDRLLNRHQTRLKRTNDSSMLEMGWLAKTGPLSTQWSPGSLWPIAWTAVVCSLATL